MLIYLGFGVLVFALGLVLLRAFVEANPAKLARATRTVFISAAVTIAIVALILFIVSERFGLGVAEIAALAPLLLRAWAQWRRHQGASPSPGRASEVETDYLRMHLDHAPAPCPALSFAGASRAAISTNSRSMSSLTCGANAASLTPRRRASSKLISIAGRRTGGGQPGRWRCHDERRRPDDPQGSLGHLGS